jgi:hypothetical protein
VDILPADISPAPWKFTQGGVPGWRITDSNDDLVCFSKDNPYTAPNAEFIVWARNKIENLIYENEKIREQEKRIIKKTTQMREMYEILIRIEQWLVESNQPDTYIQEFKKLFDDSGIFRESAL